MLFSALDYARLHRIVFSEDYPGYRPDVIELPNGDGRPDTRKRFAHISLKYLRRCKPSKDLRFLYACLYIAHNESRRVADVLGVPQWYRPQIDDATLRVIEYPQGAGSAEHKDFDLFTLLCYRSASAPLQLDASAARYHVISPGLHVGEIGELCGLGPATVHSVRATDTTQHAIVHFAIPDHAAQLPGGQTVGAWLAERAVRSRAPR